MSPREQIAQLVQETIGNGADPNQMFFVWAEALAARLSFPLTAVWWDETFSITGVDLVESSHSHGLKMIAPTMPEPLPYHELSFVSPDASSAKWLAAFDNWQEANL